MSEMKNRAREWKCATCNCGLREGH